MEKDNCSNCESSKVRRSEPFCTNKKSAHYLTVTSLGFVCDCYGRGTQVEILSSDGKTVVYPLPEK